VTQKGPCLLLADRGKERGGTLLPTSLEKKKVPALSPRVSGPGRREKGNRSPGHLEKKEKFPLPLLSFLLSKGGNRKGGGDTNRIILSSLSELKLEKRIVPNIRWCSPPNLGEEKKRGRGGRIPHPSRATGRSKKNRRAFLPLRLKEPAVSASVSRKRGRRDSGRDFSRASLCLREGKGARSRCS